MSFLVAKMPKASGRPPEKHPSGTPLTFPMGMAITPAMNHQFSAERPDFHPYSQKSDFLSDFDDRVPGAFNLKNYYDTYMPWVQKNQPANHIDTTANLGTQRTLQERSNPYSFRNLIGHPKHGEFVRQELGETYTRALAEIFSSGGNLSSEVLRSRRLRVRKLIPSTILGMVKVYHAARWGDRGLVELFELNGDRQHGGRISKKEINRRAISEERFAQMFWYLRVKRKLDNDNPLHHWFGLWLRSFYVGISVPSVLDICPNDCDVLEFHLDPEAWALAYEHKLWEAAIEEIEERFPKLRSHTPLRLSYVAPDKHQKVFYHPLQFIIAEESNISLLDYGQKRLWFQVIMPSIFRTVRLVQGKCREVS